MSSRLMKWKKTDGEVAEGILYLPEDFDSTMKYPVLFHCYERMSDHLNDYIKPDLDIGRINIPYYVSHGYLVFEPNITWHLGAAGAGVMSTLVSAIRYLSTCRWADSTRIGLLGHSFGGWVANYAVTHTHIFAAVCASSGFSNGISESGTCIKWRRCPGSDYPGEANL